MRNLFYSKVSVYQRNFLCCDNSKTTFRKHYKIAIEIKARNFQFCFRFLWRDWPGHLSQSTWPAVAPCCICRLQSFVSSRNYIILQQNLRHDGESSCWIWRSNLEIHSQSCCCCQQGASHLAKEGLKSCFLLWKRIYDIRGSYHIIYIMTVPCVSRHSLFNCIYMQHVGLPTVLCLRDQSLFFIFCPCIFWHCWRTIVCPYFENYS